jgi:predicted O-methyltransferase YrrM
MDRERWSVIDHYFTGTLHADDPVLTAALAGSDAAGLPSISVSPAFGKLLNLLVRMRGAKTILEVGTLGGYSTIWLARALPPGGRLITIELDPKHAAVARANIERAGLSGTVDIRLGRGLDVLPVIASEGLGPFDFVFIDADKPSNGAYMTWALQLTRPGSVIVVDNVTRGGAVVDAASTDANVQGVRRLVDLLVDEPRFDATAIQTVGVKGHDGFLVGLVTDET